MNILDETSSTIVEGTQGLVSTTRWNPDSVKATSVAVKRQGGAPRATREEEKRDALKVDFGRRWLAALETAGVAAGFSAETRVELHLATTGYDQGTWIWRI